ncbi:MAG TPA: cation diffusion facilitator family transporter [Kineosporiaceae bacterium]
MSGDDDRQPRTEDGGESTVTVLVAGAANLSIAVAKAVGAAVSGSAAMLSEAAHSVADTVTEVLLFVAIRRGRRPPDARHPLGYGRESYLWALLAALATFVAGAVVSMLEGVNKILHGEQGNGLLVSYVVLAVAFVMEGGSFLRALQQVRRGARRWRMRMPSFLRHTSDTAVKAVALEDAAALVGLVIAAVGLGLSAATGSPLWDGLASVVIGLMLVVVAVSLVRSNSSLLVGRAALPVLEETLRHDLSGVPGVVSIPLFVTTITGPGRLLVAAKVEFSGECTAGDIERIADDAERRFVARFPGVEHVFLDPTAHPSRRRAVDPHR